MHFGQSRKENKIQKEKTNIAAQYSQAHEAWLKWSRFKYQRSLLWLGLVISALDLSTLSPISNTILNIDSINNQLNMVDLVNSIESISSQLGWIIWVIQIFSSETHKSFF